MTYGEPGPWQPTIVADTLVISPGQSFRTENAAAALALSSVRSSSRAGPSGRPPALVSGVARISLSSVRLFDSLSRSTTWYPT